MRTYKIGETFVHEGKIFTTCKEIRMCKGCDFFKFDGKTGTCIAPSKTDCFDKIFKKVKEQPKKHTFWRKMKAVLLWNEHFYKDSKNAHIVANMNINFNNI